MTILSALCLREPLASMYLPGATDSPVFLTYLKKVLLPRLWEGAIVVLDNLGAHKVKGVQALLESVGARLVCLPPYSPDFNPIELAWSKFKNHLRAKAARTRRALARAIRTSLATITADDALLSFVASRLGLPPEAARRLLPAPRPAGIAASNPLKGPREECAPSRI